tara:strand:+ start:6399 stop:6560 length:162 start_codon:yes stop_codon:yes gene_type:complete
MKTFIFIIFAIIFSVSLMASILFFAFMPWSVEAYSTALITLISGGFVVCKLEK